VADSPPATRGLGAAHTKRPPEPRDPDLLSGILARHSTVVKRQVGQGLPDQR